MSEKPKAGEWWENQVRARKFIVGENAYGRIVTQSHGGGLYSESVFEKWPDWRRLDGCTSFDWKESLPTDLVTQDRVTPRAGIDEILIPGIGQVCWTPVHRTDVITIKHGQTVGEFGPIHVRCRRKDLPPIPASEPEPTDAEKLERLKDHFGQAQREAKELLKLMDQSIETICGQPIWKPK